MAAATTSFSSGFNNNNNADQSTDSSATISKSGNVASLKPLPLLQPIKQI